jgi:methanogenic corrinoid protein MtbC1
MSDKLVDAIADMKEPEALQIANEMLDTGEDPLKVLELCRKAMELVGKRFEDGTYFLPELMLAGDMLEQIAKLAKPKMTKEAESVSTLGTVLIGTVDGDIHDIGKDIVTFMLDVNAFKVHDLGVDIAPQKFVDAIKEVNPEVVALSGLLTLAFDSMKKTVEAITEAGLRDKVKIMIGGGAIDDEVRKYTGADAYGADAMAAVSLAKKWTGGN